MEYSNLIQLNDWYLFLQAIPIWPQSIASWLAFILAIAGVGGLFIRTGRLLQKFDDMEKHIDEKLKNFKELIKKDFDGMGGRVEKIDTDNSILKTKFDETLRQVAITVSQNTALITTLGETRAAADQAIRTVREIDDDLSEKLGDIKLGLVVLEKKVHDEFDRYRRD